jgi:hypothetical protein
VELIATTVVCLAAWIKRKQNAWNMNGESNKTSRKHRNVVLLASLGNSRSSNNSNSCNGNNNNNSKIKCKAFILEMDLRLIE